MYYYIQDPFTLSLLYIDHDPYLVSALNAGVLDCVIKNCNQKVYQDIIILKNNDRDVKFNKKYKLEITELSLELKRKKSLIEIRVPAYRLLIEKLQLAQATNILGFNKRTPQIISSMLKDNDRICEYAKIMEVSPEFALNELTMLADSLTIDDFRIFTLSMFWQKKINSCETDNDVISLMEPIRRSFWSAGIPYV